MLSLASTILIVIGWIAFAAGFMAAIYFMLTGDSLTRNLIGLGAFFGGLIACMQFVAQGELIRCIMAIEENTRT